MSSLNTLDNGQWQNIEPTKYEIMHELRISLLPTINHYVFTKKFIIIHCGTNLEMWDTKHLFITNLVEQVTY